MIPLTYIKIDNTLKYIKSRNFKDSFSIFLYQVRNNRNIPKIIKIHDEKLFSINKPKVIRRNENVIFKS